MNLAREPDCWNHLCNARAFLLKAGVEVDGTVLAVRGEFEPYTFLGFSFVPFNPPRPPVDKFLEEEIGA